jgi:uncharacterized protein (TIGR02145 family)
MTVLTQEGLEREKVICNAIYLAFTDYHLNAAKHNLMTQERWLSDCQYLETLNYILSKYRYELVTKTITIQEAVDIIKYGYLYNCHALDNMSPICASNARIPTAADWLVDIQGDGDQSLKGGPLKEIGTTHWLTPNTGATNLSGFNALPSGNKIRSTSNTFTNLGYYGTWWSKEETNATSYEWTWQLAYDTAGILSNSLHKSFGFAVRLIVTTPIEISESNAIYVGNDGRRYRCKLINNVWWTVENLMETKYRDGSIIPEQTNDTLWADATTGMRCSYDNLESNAVTTSQEVTISIPDYENSKFYLGAIEVTQEGILGIIDYIHHYSIEGITLTNLSNSMSQYTDLVRFIEIAGVGTSTIAIGSEYLLKQAFLNGVLIPSSDYTYTSNVFTYTGNVSIGSSDWFALHFYKV